MREADRRCGVADLLMQRLFDIARQQGCGRVEWQTEHDNTSARRFYEALGAKIHDGKVFYRVEL
ncbi:GNAT family N-acetyltransferase [Sphaerisporangium flaviroseum]|uniref:GNAT family N-acetyltransferase n=1 Tax=Sphaerisporangium flaviroseum TaxID=509199 RepID=UPI0031EF09CA